MHSKTDKDGLGSRVLAALLSGGHSRIASAPWMAFWCEPELKGIPEVHTTMLLFLEEEV